MTSAEKIFDARHLLSSALRRGARPFLRLRDNFITRRLRGKMIFARRAICQAAL